MEYKTLKQLCTITKGQTGIQKAVQGEYPLVVTSEERKSHNEFQFDANAVIVPLVSGTGHGHASIKRIHYQEGKFALGSILCAIIPKDEEEINSLFLYYYLNLVKEKELVGRMKGMANVTLPVKEIEKIPIPLLTIEEQLKFVDFYTNLKRDSNYITTELDYQIDLISQLRQAFLREAMQGKLVSNKTSDGKTGADLLQEIQAEKEKLIKERKTKKSKPLPSISDDEIPFEIPENWVWCRLGEILKEFLSGNAFKSNLYSKEETKNYIIRLGNVKNNVVDEELKPAYIDNEYATASKKYLLQTDDILITMTGTRGKKDYLYTAIVKNKENKNLFLNQRVGCLRFYNLNTIFLNYLLKLNFVIDPIFDSSTGAANQANVGVDAITKAIIPIPPNEVQLKIVSKLTELMEYCDNLEKSVKESQNYNEQLLQQVLREALEGRDNLEDENLKLVAEESPIYSIQNTINKNCDTGDMAILAGYIIKKLSTQNSNDFGRVKLQKMLHLVEYHCQLSSQLKYQKNVAGPHAWELEHVIEPKLKSLRFFEIKKDKFGATSKVTYTPLSASNELLSLFNREFKDQADGISNLLDKFQAKTWEFCEMISTMYAVWNNRLIKKELFTDDILKQDFLDWDDKKKRFIDQLDYALEWIRKEKIEPVGFGAYISKN
ncbi:restriction endonuclease subunit S [Sphingobacterium multivorum]|uniref:restriction endonuclease subunit S n=1 Tax=Sphingobacterium multivorum TaxID=28454 RepID=UPI0028998E5D|nr:restriction endonuclease subunit S [Sphingobacterium multivorum]